MGHNWTGVYNGPGLQPNRWRPTWISRIQLGVFDSRQNSIMGELGPVLAKIPAQVPGAYG